MFQGIITAQFELQVTKIGLHHQEIYDAYKRTPGIKKDEKRYDSCVKFWGHLNKVQKFIISSIQRNFNLKSILISFLH